MAGGFVKYFLIVLAFIFVSGFVVARERVLIVGSSTVFPFSATVAERFGQRTRFKTPIVEVNGTGGGMKLFCAGLGAEYPDIVNASRQIRESEWLQCQANGISVIEVKVGLDAVVIANSISGPEFELTFADIFQALARHVVIDGKLTANPYRTWRDVNPALPDIEIRVFGPPMTSGTRDSLSELIMESGSVIFPALRLLAKSDLGAFRKVAHGFREDGHFIEAGENDNLIVQKLIANPTSFGIFGFSFLNQNAGKVKGLRIEGARPDFDTISSGFYRVSRPVYIYIKKEHIGIISGLKEYIAEYTSERALGDEGYLADKGLISFPPDERERIARIAREMVVLSWP
ncbi:MAG: substrate-binding domain-containing protein [Alphaproteobacteria bacterium]|nr:substrate-binding domain-containing protein [Alphaproteobacteria bacterium]